MAPRVILTAAMKRCWAGDADPLMLAYHDREWGVPLHGDRELFAKLVLDGFQAGLSWSVILHKRARFLEVFDGFDPEHMAHYDAKRIARLLRDPGIVRNRQKVRAAVSNADRKSTRLNSSHLVISYAVFCLKKKKTSAIPSP